MNGSGLRVVAKKCIEPTKGKIESSTISWRGKGDVARWRSLSSGESVKDLEGEVGFLLASKIKALLARNLPSSTIR